MHTTNQIQGNLSNTHTQDGMGEIFAGAGILFAGLGLFIDMPWFGGIIVPVLYPAWKDATKRLRARRIKQEGLSPSQAEATRGTFMGLILLGVMTFILGLVVFGLIAQPDFFPGISRLLRDYFLVFMGILAALLIAAVGVVTHQARYFLEALGALAVFVAGYLFKFSLEISLTLLGGFIFIVGLFVLLRFLGENPPLERN